MYPIVFLHIPYIGSYPISLSREINTASFVGRGLGGEGVVKLRLRNHLSQCPRIENRADIRGQEGGLTWWFFGRACSQMNVLPLRKVSDSRLLNFELVFLLTIIHLQFLLLLYIFFHKQLPF